MGECTHKLLIYNKTIKQKPKKMRLPTPRCKRVAGVKIKCIGEQHCEYYKRMNDIIKKQRQKNG